MSTYKGVWPDPYDEANIKVTVDDQPLQAVGKNLAGAAQTFGWGNFSTWAKVKLLASSIMSYEIETLLHAPEKFTFLLTDGFATDRVAKFDKQWTITSEEIRAWIEKKDMDAWFKITSATKK